MFSLLPKRIKLPDSPESLSFIQQNNSAVGTPLEESTINFQIDATTSRPFRVAKVDKALKKPLDEDGDLFRSFEVDYEESKTTLLMAFSSLGSIYGDIGTSPLYTLSAVFHGKSHLQESQIFGGISCVFWLFTIVVVFKYIFIVMIYGPNNGEGGQIAIYTKIASAMGIGPHNNGDDDIDRAHISDEDFLLSRTRMSKSNYNHSYFVSHYLSKIILFLCFFGCSLVIADGFLTPTTSILSAVEGIGIKAPEISHMILPVSCVILVILFSIQRFGAGNISLVFAPLIFIWLILLGGIGVYNISLYPQILKSFNPEYAISFLINEGGLNTLGSVMLCVTGTEAMFADIGHFGRLPIQLTLLCYVYPCLILAYFGQGAYLAVNPDKLTSIFYTSIPGGPKLYWAMFILAVLATIIASQALILGVFSILRQLIQIDCFPSFKIVHSSKTHCGQVYLPAINFLLMIGVIGMTIGFGSSAKASSAYGLGVSLDFFLTTLLITIAMVYVYEMHIVIPLLFCLFFGAIDMLLLCSNMRKLFAGAWVPLILAVVITCFILFWHWGRENVKQNFRHPELLERRLTEDLSHDERPIIKKDFSTITFIYTENINITPCFIMNSLNSIMIFVNCNIEPVPYLFPFYDDMVMERLSPGFYKATINFGFMDNLLVDTTILERLISEVSAADLAMISKVEDVDIIHVIEREKVRAKRNFYCYEGDRTTVFGKVMCGWYGCRNNLRKYIIEYCFSTIHDLFNSNDILDSELVLGEGETDVVYLESIVRI